MTHVPPARRAMESAYRRWSDSTHWVQSSREEGAARNAWNAALIAMGQEMPGYPPSGLDVRERGGWALAMLHQAERLEALKEPSP
jgi:hypothetical protein